MKNKFPFRILLIVFVFAMQLSPQVSAQKKLHVGADIVSSYVWRGLLYNPVPNIQPSITFTSGDESFSIGTWGSYGIGSYYGEVDFFTTYSVGGLTLALWDYYVMPADFNYNFFNYINDETGHSLEFSAVYEGPENIPFCLTWGTFFYGNDLNEAGNNMYSSYFELGYNFNIGDTPIYVFTGFTPWESFYAPEFSLINVGLTASRSIKITESFELPVGGGLYFNPQAKSSYLVFTLSF